MIKSSFPTNVQTLLTIALVFCLSGSLMAQQQYGNNTWVASYYMNTSGVNPNPDGAAQFTQASCSDPDQPGDLYPTDPVPIPPDLYPNGNGQFGNLGPFTTGSDISISVDWEFGDPCSDNTPANGSDNLSAGSNSDGSITVGTDNFTTSYRMTRDFDGCERGYYMISYGTEDGIRMSTEGTGVQGEGDALDWNVVDAMNSGGDAAFAGDAVVPMEGTKNIRVDQREYTDDASLSVDFDCLDADDGNSVAQISKTACLNSTTAVSLSYTGGYTGFPEWQSSIDGGANWTDLGTSASPYNVVPGQDTWYRLKFTSCCTEDFSNIVVADVDDAPPVINCPTFLVEPSEPGLCSAVVDWTIVGTDNCPGSTVTFSPAPNTVFPVGPTVVTATITDGNNNSASCSFTVIVFDSEPPVLSECPADVTAECDDISPVAPVTASDNCGAPVISFAENSAPGACPQEQTLVRTWTATDAGGNSSSCTQVIDVVDTTPPTLAGCPPDITVECDAVPAPPTPTANDNCDASPDVTMTTATTPGSCAGEYTLTHTWTATDACGNASSCSQTVTVQDNTPPTLAGCPPDITVECDAVPVPPLPTANDNCDASPVITMTTATTPGSCANNYTLTHTWTATDDCGNSASCSQTVTVEDTTPPDAPPAPADLVFQCSADVTPPVALVALDNCSGPVNGVLTIAITPMGSPDNYVETRTWTFTDECDNSSSVTQTVTVEDTTPPDAQCQDITVVLDANGNTQIAVADIDAGTTDNCGLQSLALTNAIFNCSDVGSNAVDLMAEDVNGNASSCTANVEVEDNTAPVVTCADITIDLGADCNVSIDAGDVATYSDACGILSANVVPSSFTTADAGDNPVTVTVVDNNGNVSLCNATVTVLERTTTLTNLGVFSGQYSDYPTLQAQLIDDLSGDPLAGYTVEFSLNGRTASAVTNASGIATTEDIRLDQGPGNYVLTASFSGSDCYLSSSDSDPFEILQEDATVQYTGTLFASTASVNSGEATVLLSATICDIDDSERGNIANATVTFVDRDGGVIAADLPVIPLPGDSTKGTVSYLWDVDIGNFDSESFIIGTIVDNYYTRNSSEDDAVVTISIPGCDFITGGGYLIADGSAGVLAADDGTKINFGFNIKFNQAGTNLRGRLTVIVRRVEDDGVLHSYRIKGNRMTSLGFNPGDNFAEFTGKANIQDVTDPDNPISVYGNGDFRMFVTDNGEPGTGVDLIGLQFFDNGGALVFSSSWDGVQTVEQYIDGGNVVVHTCNDNGGGNGGGPNNGRTDITFEHDARSLNVDRITSTAYPNPFRSKAVIAFTLPVSERTIVEVYALDGSLAVSEDLGHLDGQIRHTWEFTPDANLSGGTYLYRIISGGEAATGKLIYQQ